MYFVGMVIVVVFMKWVLGLIMEFFCSKSEVFIFFVYLYDFWVLLYLVFLIDYFVIDGVDFGVIGEVKKKDVDWIFFVIGVVNFICIMVF